MNTPNIDPATFPWWNSFRLLDGTVIKGQKPLSVWEGQLLPPRLDGKTVLDIGAADGGFSFQAEQRGASRVVANDQWSVEKDPGSYIEYAQRNLGALLWVREKTGSRVECRDCSFLDLTAADAADVVIFSQILYHLENPVAGLKQVRRLTRERCYLESATYTASSESVMAFNVPVNWVKDSRSFWFPTRQCLQAMCVYAGFRVLETAEAKAHPIGRISLVLG